ncbi:hypothetical protein PUN28_014983 [Cardiocondyla obscurior]|uniref:Uncharacterized protein n=1 Tax=Cardiocondyla obscurior TaxID=286306 RepID=A0AAW2F039_9HYME
MTRACARDPNRCGPAVTLACRRSRKFARTTNRASPTSRTRRVSAGSRIDSFVLHPSADVRLLIRPRRALAPRPTLHEKWIYCRSPRLRHAIELSDP